jgi:predicted transglutaminase-like cysteine proteinase
MYAACFTRPIRTCLFRAVLLGALLPGGVACAESDEPFGIPTVPAPSSSLSVIWRQLQRDMEADTLTVARCRAEPDNCSSPAAVRFIEIVDEARHHAGRALVGHINRAVNLAIHPTRDGVWRSPLDALASPGDCKSYAVTKYAALGDAGVATEDRRLIIVRTGSPQPQVHLVVAVRVSANWIIMDNRSMILSESTGRHDYQPVLALDHSGVREFRARPNAAVSNLPCNNSVG